MKCKKKKAKKFINFKTCETRIKNQLILTVPKMDQIASLNFYIFTCSIVQERERGNGIMTQTSIFEVIVANLPETFNLYTLYDRNYFVCLKQGLLTR